MKPNGSVVKYETENRAASLVCGSLDGSLPIAANEVVIAATGVSATSLHMLEDPLLVRFATPPSYTKASTLVPHMGIVFRCFFNIPRARARFLSINPGVLPCAIMNISSISSFV